MDKNKAYLTLKVKNSKGRVKKWGLGIYLDEHPHNPKVPPLALLKQMGISMARTLDGHGITGKEIYDFIGK